MKASAFFGIDLGTTQSSVSYVLDSPRVREQKVIDPLMVPLDSSSAIGGAARETFQSIVGIDPSDKRCSVKVFGRELRSAALFGREFLDTFAKRQQTSALRRGRDFFTSVKSDMGTGRVYPFSRLSGLDTPVQVTAALLQQIARLTRNANPDFDILQSPVVLTVPASFSAMARNDTLEAAKLAGYADVRLLDEPVAALLDFVNHQDAGSFLSESFNNVLVFDYGGGTCDLALMKVRLAPHNPIGLDIETLAISPYTRLGGDDVDRAIVETVLLPRLGVDSVEGNPMAMGLLDTLSAAVAKRLKEGLCQRVHQHLESGGTWPSGAAASALSETVALPSRITLPNGQVLPGEYTLTFDEFSEVMEAFVEVPGDFEKETDCPGSLLRPVLETLQRGRIRARDLTRFVLHGGSSLNPFVTRMLADQLGESSSLFGAVEFRRTPSRIGSVARGAALSSYWQSARDVVLVAPILSEPLGILVSDGSAEELLPAGTKLPFPNPDAVEDVTGETERFFVPDGAAGEVLIPYFAGYAGSICQARHAGNIKVAIPDSAIPGTPVRIQLRVDADKTLRCWVSVGSHEPMATDPIHDPWTRHLPSRDERQLAAHRRLMRAAADAGKLHGNEQLIMREMLLMHLAGQLDEVVLAVSDCIELLGDSGPLRSLRATCLEELGRADEALVEYEAAVRLLPSHPVIVGNLGAAYHNAGRLDEAVAMMRRALSLHPHLGYVYEHLGDIARQRGDEAAATKELRRAEAEYLRKTNEDPFDRRAWEDLARVRANLGDYERAESAGRMMLQIDRSDRFEGIPDAVIQGTRMVRG